MLIAQFRSRIMAARDQHSAICKQIVSPFAGVNRIRFKGSPLNFGFRNADFGFTSIIWLTIRDPQSEFRNSSGLSAPALDRGSPESFCCQFLNADSRTLPAQVQCRYCCATMTAIPQHNLIKRSKRGNDYGSRDRTALSRFQFAKPGR